MLCARLSVAGGYSQAPIHRVGWEQVLDVIDHGAGLAMGVRGFDAQLAELAVGDGENDGVVGAAFRLPDDLDAVSGLGIGGVDPGIMHVDLGAVAAQFLDEVDDTGVAEVRAVFLEGEERMRAPRRGRSPCAMSLMTCWATWAPMPSLMRQPARIIPRS